ncbi:nicotinate phosphoribosyltransferase [Burkholderia ubonensis]|uniref:nicotinate phosphoribosyltransferase n=1 Tax=Burkholderia ubonensis TaxID=101571 RepID=UPI00075AE7A2|nr:nicotinate phosphoribosyltransferase [Burkholderia ubonensis]KVP96772.1 nicotinate phosphoribosyltransferase [Burkholderia ubonensis]
MNAPFAPAAISAVAKNGTIPMNLADFYKTGHPGMYPTETRTLVATFTPRADKYAPVRMSPFYDKKVVWYGLQGFIKEFLIEKFNDEFFARPKAEAVRKYKRRVDSALGVGKVAMTQIEKLHDLGYLPLEIRSVPEGSRVNIKVPPVVFINTHDAFAWVATYFETLFSCEMWKPTTVATIAFEFRKLLTYFARLTGSPEDFVGWQGHDFSMRGMSGVHDAARCGGGHQLSFFGTDTIPAIDYLEDYYGANSEEELIGGSVPATEHSVMTLRILLVTQRLQRDPANAGKDAKELRRMAEFEVIRELITDIIPEGIISIVADSFDFWNVITNIAPALKDFILARKPDSLGNSKVVFRPDSGDPVKILTGYCDDELLCDGAGKPVLRDGFYTVYGTGLVAGEKEIRITEAERKGAVECLWDSFGGSVTDKGFKLLDPHVGLIYGDSITLERAMAILSRLAAKGFASGNVVFGIGSFTYQVNSRDSFGWAMKAQFAEVGDEAVEIYKDPATDDGTKKSAKGLLRVEQEGKDFVLYDQQTREQFDHGALVAVFRDSKMLVEETVKGMRERLWASWTCPELGSVKFPA